MHPCYLPDGIKRLDMKDESLRVSTPKPPVDVMACETCLDTYLIAQLMPRKT